MCRLCGNNGPTSTPKHLLAKEIDKAFDIKVALDPEAYPTRVCQSCRCKLDRWWKRARKGHNACMPDIKVKQLDEVNHDKEEINILDVIKAAAVIAAYTCQHSFPPLSVSWLEYEYTLKQCYSVKY